MTYLELYEDALRKLHNNLITLGEFEMMVKPLNREVEAEPKKGKWIRAHGYVTPGGDPVWECSECGKWRHVFGVEHGSYGADVADHQWVACPNCGAWMEE